MRPRTCTWRASPPCRESGGAAALPCPPRPERGPEETRLVPSVAAVGERQGGGKGALPEPSDPAWEHGGSGCSAVLAAARRGCPGGGWVGRAPKSGGCEEMEQFLGVFREACGEGSSHYLDEIISAYLGLATCSF